jgi:hypothetical protein
MANSLFRNLKGPQDYSKRVIQQDDMLRLAVANDANTANARKMVKLGTPQGLTEEQGKSPEELQRDLGRQEADAIKNLEDLGFGYIVEDNGRRLPISRLIAEDLAGQPDKLIKFNALYPSIKRDLLSRFNPKMITGQFFQEFLDRYFIEFDLTKGLANSSANIVELTTNELQRLLPTADQLARLSTRLRKVTERGIDFQPIIDRLDAVEAALPSAAFYAKVDALALNDPVEANRVLREVADNLDMLPTYNQMERLIDQKVATNQELLERVNTAVGGLSGNMLANQEELLAEFGATRGATKAGAEPKRAYIMAKDQPFINTPFGSFKATQNDLYYQDGPNSLVKVDKAVLKAIVEANPDIRNVVFADGTPLKNSVASLQQYILEQSNPLLDVGSVSAASEVAYRPRGQPTLAEFSARKATTATAKKEADKTGVGFHLKKIGRGISIEREPTYAEFGKYAIHLGQLKNNDILNVKYKSLGGIPQFKPTAISDNLKDFILDVLETGKANQRVYDNIPPNERKMFEKIASGAGVFHTLKLKKTITDTDKADNTRFEVLRGEYFAGNNSPKVLAELRRFIVKFMSEGKIPRSEGMTLLMELSI